MCREKSSKREYFAACEAPSCRDASGEGPRRAEPGLRLCGRCRNHLQADLAALPGLYEDLMHVLSSSARGVPVRVSGSRTNGLPINEAVATVRSTTIGVLASWAGMVADERAVPAPDRDAGTLVAFLNDHLDWIAAQAPAADMLGEISRLAASARRVAHSDSPRRINLGTCVESTCDSPVYAAMLRQQDAAIPWRIYCEAGHVWPEKQWPFLSLKLRAANSPDEVDMTPTSILPTKLAAAIVGVSETTVRKWASRGRLTRYGRPGRAEYDVDELAALVAERGFVSS